MEGIQELVGRVSSASGSIQDEAILQLAMLLEFNRYAPEFRAHRRREYEDAVPPELLVDLDEESEREVLTRLGEVTRSVRFKPSILWAIGRAKPALACAELVAILSEPGRILQDPEAIWQGVAALDNCYAPQSDAVRRCFAHRAVGEFLQSATDCDDERARETAGRLARRLQEDAIKAK